MEIGGRLIFNRLASNALAAAIAATAVVGGWGASPAAAQQAPPSLLTHTGGAKAAGLPTDNGESVVRKQFVEVNVDALKGLKGLKDSVSEPVTFNFFEDFSPVVVFEKAEKASGPAFSLKGRVEGVPLATAFLVQRGEAVVADVRMPGGDTYQIRYRGKGVHEALQVLEGKQAPCGVGSNHKCAGVHSTAKSGGNTAAPKVDADTLVIDVMIAYTTEARIGEGGTDGILANIDLAFLYANLAYENSKINLVVRPIHTVEVPYDPSFDMSEDLRRLTIPDDGIMDNLHDLRNEYQADMVSLFVGRATSACGVAWIMTDYYADFEPAAFSVCAVQCLSNQTFAHELGHNMGCSHARYDGGGGDGGGKYSYSWGHRWVGESGVLFRSIMAYEPGTRVEHFSSPDIEYDGRRTGVPLGNPFTEADNARTIRQTMSIIASFRIRSTNDQFAAAEPLDNVRSSGSSVGDNFGFTREPGEPATVAGIAGGRSAWWKWTAPKDGTEIFDTQGSGVDTVLGVYTGTLGALTLVGENDDYLDYALQSRVECAVQAGVTYHILVDGYDGAQGLLKLNWARAGSIGDAPALAPIGNAAVPVGTAYVGPLPNLTEGGQSVTWTLIAGPAGMSINAATGLVSWPVPVMDGSPHSITIRATNSAGFADESWQLNVTAAVPPTHTRYKGYQKTAITSADGGGYQEVVYNYEFDSLQVSSYRTASALIEYSMPPNQWHGIYHYDYNLGRFSQASYKIRQAAP